MREEDTQEIRAEYRKKRTFHSVAGILLILLGGALFFVEPPFDHSHTVHQIAAGALVAFGGMFIDKGITLDFIEMLVSLLSLKKEEKNESDGSS